MTPDLSLAFDAVEFADNPEPRCPIVLLLDSSSSMSGTAIAELNSGLRLFYDELADDALARKRVEAAIVSFGPVKVERDFGLVVDTVPPALVADGNTPMGAAISKGLQLLSARKALYRASGTPMFRPWVLMITDGAPTDDWSGAARLIAEGEARGSFSFYAVGVEKADLGVLTDLSTRPPLMLRGLAFTDLFQWLSNSMSSLSRSSPGMGVPLVNPIGIDGWATAA